MKFFSGDRDIVSPTWTESAATKLEVVDLDAWKVAVKLNELTNTR